MPGLGQMQMNKAMATFALWLWWHMQNSNANGLYSFLAELKYKRPGLR